jgi:hypothetical protein
MFIGSTSNRNPVGVSPCPPALVLFEPVPLVPVEMVIPLPVEEPVEVEPPEVPDPLVLFEPVDPLVPVDPPE